jgi:MFS family permease
MNALPPDPAQRARSFQFFLGGGALWFGGMGLQQVLMPYLVTVELHEPAARVGLAMMMLQLPSLVLAFPAGALADRNDPRRQLLIATGLAILPPLVFAGVLFSGNLSYATLLLFGVTMGALSAFTMTARDTMLATIADPAAMQRAVGAFTIATFGAQLTGMGLAASAQFTGPAPLFIAEAAAIVLSVVLIARTRRLAARPPVTTRGRADMAEGLSFARGHSAIRAVLLAMLGVGVFYVGSYIVLVPLIVRDVYQGDAIAFALVNVCFWGGSVISNLILMRRPIARRGRAMLLALTSGAIMLGLMSLDAPFPVFCLFLTVWGMGAGVSLNMGRTMVQEGTPPHLRGRMLALFQLGFIGGAPIGAGLLGLLAGVTGPQTAMLAAGLAAAVVITSLALFTTLPHVTRAHPA